MAPPASICLFPRRHFRRSIKVVPKLISGTGTPFFYVQVEDTDHGTKVISDLARLHYPVEMVTGMGEDMIRAILPPHVPVTMFVPTLVHVEWQVPPIKVLPLPSLNGYLWNKYAIEVTADLVTEVYTRDVKLIELAGQEN